MGGARRFGNWLTQLLPDRGAALVEMAMVLPLLILLLIGIFTTARAWNIHNVLDHAAREAARYGATEPDPTAILTVAEGVVLSASYPWGDVTPCVNVIENGSVVASAGAVPCIAPGSGSGQDPTTDDRVQIALSIEEYQLNFAFWETSVDLSARAVARSEP